MEFDRIIVLLFRDILTSTGAAHFKSLTHLCAVAQLERWATRAGASLRPSKDAQPGSVLVMPAAFIPLRCIRVQQKA